MIEVIAQSRALQGTSASRRLRGAGKVPGIVYGGAAATQLIEIDHNALYYQLRNESFHSTVLNMNIDGTVQTVLLRASQWHPFKQLVLHVDFQRVDASEKLHMKVPLHFINADVAPGVKMSGSSVSHVLNEVEISCLPANLPEFIEVDLSKLEAGHSIHLADLTMPAGVELVALNHGDNQAVASIAAVRGGAAKGE